MPDGGCSVPHEPKGGGCRKGSPLPFFRRRVRRAAVREPGGGGADESQSLPFFRRRVGRAAVSRFRAVGLNEFRPIPVFFAAGSEEPLFAGLGAVELNELQPPVQSALHGVVRAAGRSVVPGDEGRGVRHEVVARVVGRCEDDDFVRCGQKSRCSRARGWRSR